MILEAAVTQDLGTWHLLSYRLSDAATVSHLSNWQWERVLRHRHFVRTRKVKKKNPVKIILYITFLNNWNQNAMLYVAPNRALACRPSYYQVATGSSESQWGQGGKQITRDIHRGHTTCFFELRMLKAAIQTLRILVCFTTTTKKHSSMFPVEKRC